MGRVILFPRRRHARASKGSALKGKQSSAVTSPPVSALSAAANGADIQDLRFRMRLIVDRLHETPRKRMRSAMPSSSSPRSDMKSANCMPPNVHQAHNKIKPQCAPPGMANGGPSVHDVHTMAKTATKSKRQVAKPKWRPSNLRLWREYAGKSQTDIASKVPMSHTTLGRIESGKLPWHQRVIEVAALECGCSVCDILEREPPQQVKR